MAVNANTNKTYDAAGTLREDLQEALISITPTETPFMSMIGSTDVEQRNWDWVTVDLQNPDSGNRVLEGEAAPGNDTPNQGNRLANYTQISDKVVEVSSTANKVNGVGDLQKMAKQIAMKLKELKRDMETMLLDNVAANPGNAATARVTAGFPAFLRTNVLRGDTGANGTLSGTTQGYVNAAATNGTLRALTEAMLNSVIRTCWEAGAEPTTVLCGGLVKQKISQTFTGTATKFRDQGEKKITNAIDVYVSDFGTLQIVPTRLGRARDVLVIDPEYVKLAWLQKTTQTPLAKTGHADRKLVANEYGLQVDTEKAHGIIADIDGSL
jgi:hypothetical protein